ncbi:hypothetical protein G6F37_007506 [Rhizopus arrhizus]|nr:hypothetical protein G6F38_008975 [Rhizopus arrhizus]KAG1156546.1 hypothetical protein G6F37_007506 [Rhizopus arrhizus]
MNQQFRGKCSIVYSKDGEAEGRLLCSAPQLPAANVLDMVSKLSSFNRRCPTTSMVTEGDIFISNLETDTSGTEEISRTKGKARSSSGSIVAQLILVPDDLKDETPTTANHLENKSEMVSSRLIIINNSRLQDGLDEETKHLPKYLALINRFCIFNRSQSKTAHCRPTIDQKFLHSKANSEVKVPSEQQLATWDVNILVEFIKKELSPTSGLALVQL